MSKLSLIGQKVGNYVIKSLLGRGGMAKVFLAEHPRIGRQVAVKVLAPHLALQATMAERFEREARAAARLQHPNIIEIIDFGNLDDGVPYYTMELLKGRELRQVVGDKRRWSAWEVLPYLEQICAALHVAHEHQMVHRDLKPENIFVLDGQPLTLKILDFGIAKLLEGGDATLTTSGTLLGSPVFAAPEQAAGDTEAICPQTDIYSLGIILYWMLCGTPPFESKTSGLLIAQHINDTPPPLLTKNPAVPQGVAELVHRCLQKKPGDRPATAREVVKQFEDTLKNLDRDALKVLEDELQASSGEGGDAGEDGLPDEGLSKSMIAFLGMDEEEASTDDAAPGAGGTVPPRLEPRVPEPPAPRKSAPPPPAAQPAPEEKAPVLLPRVPAAAPSPTPSSRPLDLPPPMEACDLPQEESRKTADPFQAAESRSTDILSLDELTAEADATREPAGDAEEEDDDRPTERALPLFSGTQPGLGPEQPTVKELPLLGDVEDEDEDERPTEVALPLLGDAPAGDSGTEDEAVTTAVLGLIGDDTERSEVLGLAADDEPEDDAVTTAVLGLIGDDTERSKALGLVEDDEPEDDAAKTTVLGLIGDEDD